MDTDGPRVLTCDETPNRWGPDDEPGDWEDFCDPIDNARYGGQPTPQWYGSAQTTINLFKYVQLYALFNFNSGFQLFDGTSEFLCGFLGGGPGGGTCSDIIESTSGGFATSDSGELTDEAQIKAFAAGIQSADPWYDTGNFAKLATVQLRFDMPPSVLRFLKMSGMSIQFIGENLASWSGYGGLDPEINNSGQTQASRAEFLTLPPTRRFIGTINLFF
ncbi:MAG: hypothetical protein P8Y26_15995 [Gemmatimonadales bacterium]